MANWNSLHQFSAAVASLPKYVGMELEDASIQLVKK
jgi:hypothetical protein